MKKEKIKGFLMGVICTTLVMSSVLGAAAATGAVDLQATYRNIIITLNGNQLTPTDANGKSVEPFIVDGTTYLPVRAVSEALGLDVSWNNSTNTVVLTGTPVVDSGIITVKNTAELKAALRRSNAEVRLSPGTYSSFDAFSIENVTNLKIVGGDGVKMVTNSGTDRILDVSNSNGVQISGITMGHELGTSDYYCTAGVIGLYNSYDVTFTGCDIYGCGTMGFDGMDSQNVSFKNCKIHDCSDCIASLNEGTASFTNCSFEGNGYGDYRTTYAFYCYYGSSFTFTNCDFKNNYNEFFCYLGEEYEQNFANESGCTYSGNAWEKNAVG